MPFKNFLFLKDDFNQLCPFIISHSYYRLLAFYISFRADAESQYRLLLHKRHPRILLSFSSLHILIKSAWETTDEWWPTFTRRLRRMRKGTSRLDGNIILVSNMMSYNILWPWYHLSFILGQWLLYCVEFLTNITRGRVESNWWVIFQTSMFDFNYIAMHICILTFCCL